MIHKVPGPPGNNGLQKGASRNKTVLAFILYACLYLSFFPFVISDFHSPFGYSLSVHFKEEETEGQRG